MRGLLWTRLALRRPTTFLKNRISAALRRYGLRDDDCSDLFGNKARILLANYISFLPKQTRFAVHEEWDLLDETEKRVDRLEERVRSTSGNSGGSAC